MGAKTSIEWTDSTWNPIRGCSRVSEGCRNCYAERLSARGLPGHKSPTTGDPFAITTPSGPRWTGKVELIEKALALPLKWKTPRRIFVNSMSDLFHENLDDESIDQVMAIIILSDSHRSRRKNHTMQVLTKRPERMASYMADQQTPFRVSSIVCKRVVGFRPSKGSYDWHAITPWPPDNCWLGVSVEDQKTADERIPWLLKTPAAVRFVSYEPALGPVDFRFNDEFPDVDGCYADARHSINWVIMGGESGPGSRPMHPVWARSVRDQCAEVGVPFFFKQWGDWAIASAENGVHGSRMPDTGGKFTWVGVDGKTQNPSGHGLLDPVIAVARFGKKRAGRLLYGCEHLEFPV